MATAETWTWRDRRRRLLRVRAGQILGLLYLLGPVSDLADSSLSGLRLWAVAAAVAAFVAVYLLVLPPIPPLERRGPWAVYAVLALLPVTAGLVLALGGPQSFVALFVYAVAAGGLLLPTRAAVAGIAVTALGVGVGLAAAHADGDVIAAHTLTVITIGTMLTAFGHHLRTIRELRAAREQIARFAVSEERLRIARDMHDLLGHTLSLIALKSDLAARLVMTDPETARKELTDVQNVTRQALAEVREAVQGYRRLAFDEALEGARAALAAAGIACRVDGGTENLPEEVESVLAWAVREAATNVVRHSGAHACSITLFADDAGVALQVVDDGTAPGKGAERGSGLAGLAERARRLHGTLEAGVRPEGGFRVRLSLPLTGPAA
ncbi:MAG TPA: sensor histidine kinase [Gaiellaceae bacterium]|nr:sensor histidine kinase [Gaiellaceae bacterium]